MPLQLAFEAFGQGPPVVILHGLLGSSRNWRSVAVALASRHRVLTVDARNHGQSPWAPTMSYPEMAEDLRMLIESEGLDRPAVVGHSMGGKTAMALALSSPGLIGRLIVVDIAPVTYPDRVTAHLAAMSVVDIPSLRSRAEAMQQMAAMLPDAQSLAFLMQNLIPRDDHFDWRLNLAAIGAAVTVLSGFPPELLHRTYGRPGTLIYGSRSDYVRPEELAALSGPFPKMDVTRIEGAGHWVHADRPIEFRAALEKALGDAATARDARRAVERPAGREPA